MAIINLGCRLKRGYKNLDKYNGVYQELAELVGEKDAKLIWKSFAGMKINFPMRFISREYVKSMVETDIHKKTIGQLVHETGYSERSIRRMIEEIRHKNDIVEQGDDL